ncbi:hypothetical protein C1C98_27610 [Pseudomonas ogarae]|uniref:Uncharacterized protein n=1 Tax=Pseudomonas ogarae (strain DSM 112162 / CECT 30235 / F113) TaxID=1114970 RepID=A0ABN5GDT3_PSEO1|nr:hypothetical protein C1C98_27610 [Pseudomonas ogarae]
MSCVSSANKVTPGTARSLWRGDLSPLGCKAAPQMTQRVMQLPGVIAQSLGTASQSSGDKSPRHR